MPVLQAHAVWSFGNSASVNATGNVTGSTGTGTRVLVSALAREQTFYIEADGGATGSYQILTARAATGGATAVLSSGTLSTSQLDVWQFTGPFQYLTVRIKTLNSTANLIVAELLGN